MKIPFLPSSSPAVRLFLPLALASALEAFAGDGSRVYWVSPTGAAAWAAAESATPLQDAACTSLPTATTNVTAGDTVFLRGGTYNSGLIIRGKNGTLAARISFLAYNDEVPVLKNTTNFVVTGRYNGLYFSECKYIRVVGIQFFRVSGDYLFELGRSSSHNEFSHCLFDGGGSFAVVNIWKGNTAGPDSDSCTHNWLHHCVFRNTGTIKGDPVDDLGGMQIGIYMGGAGFEQVSGNNTIEYCTFSSGGHHNLETYTKYNVIRNNYFHFEGSMPNNSGFTPLYGPDVNGKWGNRNIQIYDGNSSDGMFNLLEGNRFGHSGPPPDDDGGDGMTIAAPKNIIRYNFIFNSLNNGVLFKTGGGSFADNNKFYNNTVYKSGRFHNTGPQWQGYSFRWYGSYVRTGNSIINNIFNTHGGLSDLNTNSGNNTIQNNWLTSDGDPKFVDPNVDDPSNVTLPNLNIAPDSPVIDRGTHLTTAQGAGTASTSLVVQDALFFQDGTWGSSLSTVHADWIAVGTISNVVQISAINYNTNTLTLAVPMTWSNAAKIWLSGNSNGDTLLRSNAPDIGAGADRGPLPSPPSILRIH